MDKPKILIVDDEENVRNALSRWFELAGFYVDLAEDEHVAVERCQNDTYDIITMDLEMPRMNGVEAITRIKELHPKVPIVVLTGYHPRPEKVIEVGAARILNKPLSLRELEQEIRVLLA